jgi:Gly-Xaa carboxypeptidase
VEKVNTYGLAYEWTGSDKSLKPLMLAAHQGMSPLSSRFIPVLSSDAES